MEEPTERPYRISVIGTGVATGPLEQQAYDLGRALGEAGAVVITGGLGGVMAAAARGCREGGGTSVGLLPGGETTEGNRWTDLPLATGMGEGRNVLSSAGSRGGGRRGGRVGHAVGDSPRPEDRPTRGSSRRAPARRYGPAGVGGSRRGGGLGSSGSRARA